MYTLAVWARRNLLYSRCLIVSAKLLAWLLAALIGMQLNYAKIILPIYCCYAAAGIMLIASLCFYHPITNTIAAKWLHFKRRKVCDLLMPLATAIVLIASVNNADVLNAYTTANGISFTKELTAEEIISSGRSAESLTKKEKKILKKAFYHQLKQFATAVAKGDNEAMNKAWKIALAVIVLVGLVYLLAALACTLACNGSEAVAILVLVAGVTGVVFGFVAVMKAIHRGTKKVASEESKK